MRSPRRTNIKRCSTLLVLTLITLLFTASCGVSYITQKPKAVVPLQKTTQQLQGNGVAGDWPSTSEEAEVRQEQWLATNTDQVATIEDARADTARKLAQAKDEVLRESVNNLASSKDTDPDFVNEVTTRAKTTSMPRIVLPKLKSLGAPTGIFVMKKQVVVMLLQEHINTLVIVEYANGITITYSPKYNEKDYAVIVAGVNDPANKDDGEHTSPLSLITVHGFKGCGQEPGYDYFPVLGGKHLRSSMLEWADSEGNYRIKPPLLDQTVPLSNLMQIAESMY